MPLNPKSLTAKKKKKQKIVALTAYDFPFAKILDESGVDVVLVGDSLGMVLMGFETTLPVTMEHMIHHTAAAAKGVKNALLVADMPYKSYETPAMAVKNARRLIGARARAVKLEGGSRVAAQVRALVKAGIAVMGHVGMTPQSVKKFGGYKVQGKDQKRAEEILKDAILLDKLGVFAIVLECVPANLAAMITRSVKCATIGIGAGPETDGQILVLHDLLGFESSVKPRFVRRYAELDKEIRRAVEDYKEDVLSGHFPLKEESY